ncbi:MAG: SagB/ThcOx family dehydrogenase [Nitrososphaerota archaeon]|nr:SagB/ThcOx family dehydrogenase [Nitrososphaerales archaeon]MDW8044881.1 SagB/ThcOx family dehydrogenase [Nitrososphaerota archaeon]
MSFLRRRLLKYILALSVGIGSFIIIKNLLNSITTKKYNGEQVQYPQSPIGIGSVVKLPEVRLKSDFSIEEALLKRRSIRDYKDEPLTLQEVSQLLWAAQGITDPRGFRTAPSAGATYPLEVYVVVGNVLGLEKGVYKYNPHENKLVKVLDGDKRRDLAIAALHQEWVERCAIDLVFTAIYRRTTSRYGDRGIRYVHMEVGHAAQNVYLQAVSLKLGSVVIGAFYDDQVKKILNLPADEEPLYIHSIGRV